MILCLSFVAYFYICIQNDSIMKNLFVITLRILMLLVFIASCGLGYVIYEDTLTAWWIPVGMALLIALATIPFYKKWIWQPWMIK